MIIIIQTNYPYYQLLETYVEALMVPFEKTISGLLQNEVSNKRVYSFMHQEQDYHSI